MKDKFKMQMNIMYIGYCDGRTLAVLRKDIELPFTPFIGLQIGDFCISELHYDPETESFRAWEQIRANPDEEGLRDAEENIEHFKKHGWIEE